jgi:hypothetical protein
MPKKISVFSLSAYVFVFLSFFLAPIDTDLGWHLRYGQYFFQTHSFLRNNTLTYFLPGYYWPNSYSLYQILVYIFYKNFGLLSLALASSLLGLASFFLLNKINPRYRHINFLGFLAVTLFGWNVFYAGIRAQEFSFLFLIITFFILKISEKEKKYLYLLPFLFLFWANLHGGFVLAVALICFLILDGLLKRQFKNITVLLSILFLSVVFCLINPYGIGVYKEALRHFGSNLGLLIAEWVPPNLPYKIVIIATTMAAFLLLAFRKSKRKLFWALSMFSFAYLAFTARRNLAIYGLFIFLFACEQFPIFIKKLEFNTGFRNIMTICLLAGFVILIPRASLNYQISTVWNIYCQKGMLPLPCKAVEFIKKNNPKGENVFSSYEWGGFLAWQLPQFKFFIDGRTPAWPTPEGKSPYTLYLEIIQAQEGYQNSLNIFKTDWLLLPANTFLDIELQNEKSIWHEIYRDQISSVYTKTD